MLWWYFLSGSEFYRQDVLSGPATRTRAAHAVSPRTSKFCSVDDDVKLLIVNKLHSFDDCDNLIGTNRAWCDLLGRHQYLIMRGIIVSMTQQIMAYLLNYVTQLNSPTHMHDLKLSRAHKANNTFAGYQYPVADISAASRLRVAAFHSSFRASRVGRSLASRN
jgi:hypothetical protein